MFALVAAACGLSYALRGFHSKFSEHKALFFVSYNALTSGVVYSALELLFVGLRQWARLLLVAVLVAWNVQILLLAFFAPRVRYLVLYGDVENLLEFVKERPEFAAKARRGCIAPKRARAPLAPRLMFARRALARAAAGLFSLGAARAFLPTFRSATWRKRARRRPSARRPQAASAGSGASRTPRPRISAATRARASSRRSRARCARSASEAVPRLPATSLLRTFRRARIGRAARLKPSRHSPTSGARKPRRTRRSERIFAAAALAVFAETRGPFRARARRLAFGILANGAGD